MKENNTDKNTNYYPEDSAWKDVLDACFEEFLLFFFPRVHAEIDFSKKPEFFDKELQKIAPDNKYGKRYVDKLAKVYYKSGTPVWFLVHIEVQGTADNNLPFRLYQYNYRITERYGKRVITLLVLSDENPDYRPKPYKIDFCGFYLEFRYPYVKLLDYKDKPEKLYAKENPFALLVEAFLEYIESKNSLRKLYKVKKRTIALLDKKGYTENKVTALIKFIDWIMRLPAGLNKRLEEELRREEKGEAMAYITSWEKIAKEEGLEQGIEQGIEQGTHKAKLEDAKRMLQKGYPLEDIIDITDLSKEEIEKL